jgi:hypothetical protein
MEYRQLFRREVISFVVVLSAAVVWVVMLLNVTSQSSVDYSPLNTYADDQIKQLSIQVTQREAMIQQLADRVKHRDSLIFLLENKRTSITNKYYYNEKEILSSGDSVNRVMRIINQSSFESDYFAGKYAPTK